jgi:hypothetical protein
MAFLDPHDESRALVFHSLEDQMTKHRKITLALVLFALTPALCMGQALRGSGHTTLPVGNYANGSILPTGHL